MRALAAPCPCNRRYCRGDNAARGRIGRTTAGVCAVRTSETVVNWPPAWGWCPVRPPPVGRVQLLGISKRGDGYLRGLLIQGARKVIYHIRCRLRVGQPGGNAWVEELLQRHPSQRGGGSGTSRGAKSNKHLGNINPPRNAFKGVNEG
jgi:hypothetical protein